MDFEIIKERIEAAAKKAFLEMYEQHGAENIYSFALYSDEGAMTVCPAVNTLEMLKNAEEEDLLYFKYEPAEWAYESGADAEFNEICTLLRTEVFQHDDDDEWFLNFQAKLYSSCVEVLEKLNRENFFSKVTGHDVFIFFTVSDYEFEKEDIKNIITRLNHNTYGTEYLKWMDTWGN